MTESQVNGEEGTSVPEDKDSGQEGWTVWQREGTVMVILAGRATVSGGATTRSYIRR